MTSVFLISVCLCLSSGLLAANGQAPCPSGWSQFGSRCFLFSAAPKTWLNGETFCQTTGGNLASIHSEEEQVFLKDYIKREYGSYPRTWIGGFDAVKEDTWMWTDGSKFNFKSWNRGEPNNNAGGENCLVMNWYEGQWNDWACTNQTSFACSKNLCV
ncbi:hypothetical protein FQN60_006048 [Etheostoma spectabile]|uniref:C-type lectin domain-containing protein n=1 Tax=Etheostoma spectabile TaxID=54343 RepID=A0A5J5CEE7_9PERO|nr:hypothetical protein FQN60_006048 [Etheostoma spectabile]